MRAQKTLPSDEISGSPDQEVTADDLSSHEEEGRAAVVQVYYIPSDSVVYIYPRGL